MTYEPKSEFVIDGRAAGVNQPTYFVADIAANHDGDFGRARDLICLAAEAGADAAKFQHFRAETIVSDTGFRALGGQLSHQSKWDRSVFEVYQDASLDPDWTPKLHDTCKKAGIAFFTSPYDFALVDAVEPYVPAFKIGSGDITWIELIGYMAGKGKPVLLATGASNLHEVERAVAAVLERNPALVLMQCNTNYTASPENMAHVHLNVLKTYADMWPGMVLGLSDHTEGHAAVLGAVSLGARVIEKHFTDDRSRGGPDHPFSMEPESWREMVARTRELEAALGTGLKRVQPNEQETVVVQRRAIRAARDLAAGTVLTAEDLTMLRPCPPGGLPPSCANEVLLHEVNKDIAKEELIRWTDLA